MNERSYVQYYAGALAPEKLEPAPHVLKAKSYFKIKPNEANYKDISTISFTNQNLDLITVPSDSYLYMTCSIETINNGLTKDFKDDTNVVLPGVIQSNGNDAGVDFPTLEISNKPSRYWRTQSVPATAGFINGFTYKINDTTIDTVNNDLAR